MFKKEHWLKLSVALVVVAALAALAILPRALAQSAQKKAKRIEEVTVREGANKAKVKQGFEWVKKGENSFTVRSHTANTSQPTPPVEGQFECRCASREKLLRRGKCAATISGGVLNCHTCPDCKCDECVLDLR